MKKSTYAGKQKKVLDCEQFWRPEKSCVNIVMKKEKEVKLTFRYEEKKEDTG